MNKHQKNQQQDIRGWINESESESTLENILKRKTTLATLPKISSQANKTKSKLSQPKIVFFHQQKKSDNSPSATKSSPQQNLNSDVKASKDTLKPLKQKLQQILNQQESEPKNPSSAIIEDSEQNQHSKLTTQRKEVFPTTHHSPSKKQQKIDHKRAKTRLTEEEERFKKIFQRYDVDLRVERPQQMMKTQSNTYLKLHTLEMSTPSQNKFFQQRQNKSNNQLKNLMSTHETLNEIIKIRQSRQKLPTMDKIEKINEKMRQTFVRQDHLYHQHKKSTKPEKEPQGADFNDDSIFSYNISMNLIPRPSPCESNDSRVGKIFNVKTPVRYKLVLY